MLKLPDGSLLSEYGNLYILAPMLEAGRKLSEARFIDAGERGLSYFKKKPDLVQFKPEFGGFSHFFGYMMEALVDLGEVELAKKGLEQAAAIQKENGAIPAYPGVDWICSTGMAQLAVAWLKIGDIEPANKAIEYLLRIQNPSGGFFGGYGKGAEYFPTEEISWAVKFFIDALLLMTSLNAAKE
jgi:malonyl-CoA O-methyltransferase